MKTIKFKMKKQAVIKQQDKTFIIPETSSIMFLMDDYGLIHLVFNDGEKLLKTLYLEIHVAKKLLMEFIINKKINRYYENNDILEILLGFDYEK